MTGVPPKAIDHTGNRLRCEEALSDAICDVADQALHMGWSRQEIAEAIMEIANAWYFERRHEK